MNVLWDNAAWSDFMRLHRVASGQGDHAALSLIKLMFDMTADLVTNPRIGRPLDWYAPRDVRRLSSSNYEISYEIVGATVHVLALRRPSRKR